MESGQNALLSTRAKADTTTSELVPRFTSLESRDAKTDFGVSASRQLPDRLMTQNPLKDALRPPLDTASQPEIYERSPAALAPTPRA